MPGKYVKKKVKSRKPAIWLAVLLIVLAGAATAVLLWPDAPEKVPQEPEATAGASTEALQQNGTVPEEETLPEGETVPEEETETQGQTVPETETSPQKETEKPTKPRETVPEETHNAYELGDGLQIDRIDSYAGIYMEDGSDDPVSGLLMIQLTNKSDRDLQLGRIVLHFGDIQALFDATNLPAGATVILLEKNRMAYTDEVPASSELRDVLFFPEPMDTQEDRIRIEGSDGILKVTNISGADIGGDIYVYYKNYAAGQYYGGITYRARVSGGLKAGETVTLMASHYSPSMCTVVQVEAEG